MLQPLAGNIGIGTGAIVPTNKLEIVGNTSVQVDLTVWGTGIVAAEQFQGASAGGSAGLTLYSYQGDPPSMPLIRQVKSSSIAPAERIFVMRKFPLVFCYSI